jgi:hypothetical protein
MPNHVKIVMPADDAPRDAKPTYFRDVARVDLITSLDSAFDQGKTPKAEGLKHWVERTDPPMQERPCVSTVTKIKSKLPTMDLAKYRESLTRHDDGK